MQSGSPINEEVLGKVPRWQRDSKRLKGTTAVHGHVIEIQSYKKTTWKGELTMKSNNHFGNKCHKGWKGQRVYHDDDKDQECFRKYANPAYSFTDHSLFLTGRSRYAFLFKLPKDDYKAWAKGLKKAGISEDSINTIFDTKTS